MLHPIHFLIGNHKAELILPQKWIEKLSSFCLVEIAGLFLLVTVYTNTWSQHFMSLSEICFTFMNNIHFNTDFVIHSDKISSISWQVLRLYTRHCKLRPINLTKNNYKLMIEEDLQHTLFKPNNLGQWIPIKDMINP